MKTAKPVAPYNLYIRAISHNGKSCPCCKAKLEGDAVYSAGEYVRARWNNAVDRFCRKCFSREVVSTVRTFTARTGRSVNLVGYQGTHLEDWMVL